MADLLNLLHKRANGCQRLCCRGALLFTFLQLAAQLIDPLPLAIHPLGEFRDALVLATELCLQCCSAGCELCDLLGLTFMVCSGVQLSSPSASWLPTARLQVVDGSHHAAMSTLQGLVAQVLPTIWAFIFAPLQPVTDASCAESDLTPALLRIEQHLLANKAAVRGWHVLGMHKILVRNSHAFLSVGTHLKVRLARRARLEVLCTTWS
mmetsp:Transcript_2315/g.4847  ORF Transcript_2315/g.4847 Transcript_2315/m.4847 type:complete len:208 (+) Transcript_2315:711-1334(+)